jgi:hypothetical protein
VTAYGIAVEPGDGERCTAKAKTTGERCRNYAEGGGVCHMHGATNRARQRQAGYNALEPFAKLYDPTAPPVTDPIGELQRLGAIARKAMDVAGEKVNELYRWEHEDEKGSAVLKAEIQVFLHLMKQSESVLTSLAKLNLDERKVTIAERESQALVGVFDAVRDAIELALTPAQRRVWDVVVGRVIGEITESEAIAAN